MKIDPRTGRPFGDHGTGENAISYALLEEVYDTKTFLDAWAHGDLGEWPEYYEWLAKQPKISPITDNTAFAVEFGVRCAEKGMNLQATLKAWQELL